MGRLLVLVLLVVLAVWLIRRALRAHGKETNRASGDMKTTEELVRCAHCSVLLPRGEARAAGEALYCSEAHARLGPGRR